MPGRAHKRNTGIRFLVTWSAVVFVTTSVPAERLPGEDSSSGRFTFRPVPTRLASSSDFLIYGTTELSDTNDLLGPYNISTHVTSSAGISSVDLFSSADDGTTYVARDMVHVSGDLYRGAIEGAGRSNEQYSYFIQAVDSAFNVKRDPDDAPLVTYGFDVYYVPDFYPSDSTSGIENSYPGVRYDHQWEDIDADGDLDLYVALPSTNEGNLMYRNDGGRHFTDISAASGTSLTGHRSVAVSFGDYDRDGYEDLAVLASLSAPFLFENNGDGSFEDVSEQVGLVQGFIEPRDLVWLDADSDGFLDILVVAEEGVCLMMNESAGEFSNEAGWRGLPWNVTGYQQAAAFDADGDGDSEILFIGAQNGFYRNDDGYFVDLTSPSGISPEASNLSVLDVDTDGDLDVLLIDLALQFRVFENDGGGTFVDRSADYSLGPSITGRIAYGDVNTDGEPDLGFLTGHLFTRDRGRAHVDVTPFSDVDSVASIVDADGDGRTDIFTYTRQLLPGAGFPGAVENGWLAVDLRGIESNRSGVGAVVRVFTGDRTGTAHVSGASPSPGRLMLGLEDREPDSLVVRWPSGIVQVEHEVPVNTVFTVYEDTTLTGIVSHGRNSTPGLPRDLLLRQNFPNPFNPSTTLSFVVPGGAGSEERVDLMIYDSRGRLVRTLLSSDLESGSHSVIWDGRDERGDAAASGVYFSTLIIGSNTCTRKLIILR